MIVVIADLVVILFCKASAKLQLENASSCTTRKESS